MAYITKAEAIRLEEQMLKTEREPKFVGKCDWCKTQRSPMVRMNHMYGAHTCDDCTWQSIDDCGQILDQAESEGYAEEYDGLINVADLLSDETPEQPVEFVDEFFDEVNLFEEDEDEE
jgi:hypothetical protein